MIDKITEQRIKDAANIVDVIGDFYELRRKGTNYECLCPFHNDHHVGSFVVRPPGVAGGNTFRCFSCDAKGGPVEFLMRHEGMSYPDALRYLAHKYGIVIDDDYDKAKFAKVKPAQPKKLRDIPNNLPPRLWPTAWATEPKYADLSDDNLVNWLRCLPWDNAQRARLVKVLAEYAVGHVSFPFKGMRHNFTTFWQIDEKGRLHNAHLMKYKTNGHRNKESDYGQTWLHARMRYAKGVNHFDDKVNSPSYCLFGLHLLDKYPQADVHIVESEKTALIMATAYGNNVRQVWMACGGLENINPQRLAALIGERRHIVLFPDRDGIKKWRAKAQQLGYAVSINVKAVKEWWIPEDGEKADIADVVVRLIRGSHEKKQARLDEMAQKNPALRKLIDKLELKQDNGKQ